MIKQIKALMLCCLISLAAIVFYSWTFLSKRHENFLLKTTEANHKFLIHETSKQIQANDLKTKNESAAQYYCHLPDELEGSVMQEGRENLDWTLKQVHVVIRHGDRTPLKYDFYKLRGVNPDFCNIYKADQVDRDGILLKYKETLHSQYSSASLEDTTGKRSSLLMHPLPRATVCPPGHLTNLGVLQHLYNGLWLGQIYVGKHKLLKGKDHFKKIKVFSTEHERTFRSAVALLYGLVPNYHVAQIPFEYAFDASFCGRECHCPAASSLNRAINSVRYKLYLSRQKGNETIRKISEKFLLGDHTGSLMDSLVTGFLCKGMPLPCDSSSGYCINNDDLDVIMNEQEYMNKVLYEESPSRNQSMLVIQPLLQKISKAMVKAVIGDGDTYEVVLHSGHDTTLRPLLWALGIQDHRWPHLASRLVFELWESHGKHFIKILFNGKDQTSNTAFCQGTECLFSNFQHFATHGIPENFGVKTRQQACNIKF